MKNQHDNLTDQSYQLPIILLNPQDKLLINQQKSNDLLNDDHFKKFVMKLHSSTETDSMILKSSRFDKFNFLKKQSKKFKSLKCSIRRNHDVDNPHEDQEHNSTSMFNKMDTSVHQTFLRESLQKNSIMNKILSQQKKANNFKHLKNSIFESLNQKQNLNSIHLKDHIQVQNEKMAVLLSERTFPRKASFSIPFGKLKVAKQLKQAQRRNAHLNESMRFIDLRGRNYPKNQYDEGSSLTFSRKKNLSVDSLQKSAILTDELKRVLKSTGKEPSIQRRHSRIRDNERKQKKKKSLLTISDDQNDVRSSLEISVEMLTKKRVMTEPNEEIRIKKQYLDNNKLKKCQQKIMNDLIRLQKIRNQHIVNNRGQTQLKNLKANSFNNNRVKLMIINRNLQNESKQSKYIIKFKTEPNQNPLQKLKSRISSQIKDDQSKRKKAITNKALEIQKVKGLPKTFERKDSTQLTHIKAQKDKRVRLETMNHKVNYLERQLSGWDISKQTDTKENWNVSFF